MVCLLHTGASGRDGSIDGDGGREGTFGDDASIDVSFPVTDIGRNACILDKRRRSTSIDRSSNSAVVTRLGIGPPGAGT